MEQDAGVIMNKKNTKLTVTTITNHIIFIKLINSMNSVVRNSPSKIPEDNKEFKKWRKNGRTRLSRSQLYIVDVFFRASNLSRVIDRVAYSRYLIKRSPNQFLTKNNKNGRIDWTDYHYFVFTTSIASIIDCILLFVAEIYELGLAPKDCKYEVIIHQKLINGTILASKIKQLKKYLETYISRRHQFVHQGQESGFNDLVDEEEYIMFKAYNFINENSKSFLDYGNIAKLWGNQMKQVIPMLDITIISLLKYIDPILDELVNPFERRLKLYGLMEKNNCHNK
jgi:hypothetical protein